MPIQQGDLMARIGRVRSSGKGLLPLRICSAGRGGRRLRREYCDPRRGAQRPSATSSVAGDLYRWAAAASAPWRCAVVFLATARRAADLVEPRGRDIPITNANATRTMVLGSGTATRL